MKKSKSALTAENQHLYELLDANRIAINELMNIIQGMGYSDDVTLNTHEIQKHWIEDYMKLEADFANKLSIF